MSKVENLGTYPFARVQQLLAEIPNAQEPVNLMIGEPKVAPPSWVSQLIASHDDCWNRYPPIPGTPALRAAIKSWLCKRFALNEYAEAFAVDPTCGSREGLFLLAMLTRFSDKSNHQHEPKNTIAMPNPGYAVYAGSARIAGAEVLALDTHNGDFPYPHTLSEEQLHCLRLVFLCSPDNPSGNTLSKACIRAWIEAGRTYDFIVACDECYSELYADTPPVSILNIAMEIGGEHPFDQVICLNSLSKRSSCAGMRSALLAGDPKLIAKIGVIKSYAGGRMPIALQETSIALWQDEEHVVPIRQHYRDNYALVRDLKLGNVTGGMFLWLRVENDLEATQHLWREGGLQVLPGRYLCTPAQTTPGEKYIRVALVHAQDILKPALETLCRLMKN